MRSCRVRDRRTRFLSVAALVIVLAWGLVLTPCSETQLANPTTAVATAQELNPETQGWLRAAVTQGRFAELRWPDFSDYTKHLKKF